MQGKTLKEVMVDGQIITPEEHTKQMGLNFETYTCEYNMVNHEIHVDWIAVNIRLHMW